ncbi:membrane-anchored ubiquitin-fold protein 3-like isoform X1 [Chenopodium quinoa]|uniref:membrane-anchored ubiquitin-fold protein 3-like isoform X1 n=1 Tax=Chenopodium quinoa TaxID=63459 RepID=UPI000B78251C|nr:membrane-anchored ubiquitin-fold protein 3-like isoform X1 [Chenopodium quinoa]XP_021737439.1 membrane-anchored ubiquitin-fold protein 3-like isoform X1 [Chenopodium quinoa]
MPEEDLVDIKFRLYDGSDIGPFRYSSASTIEMLKERIVSEWPKGKTVVPKVANEIKLINFGKILENNKTVGQCRAPFGELTGGVMVMHVVVQPSQTKTKAGFATCHQKTQKVWTLDCWIALNTQLTLLICKVALEED